MKEFIVNDYIKLKLEDGNTVIYVNGEFFDQCKYVLLRKRVDELEDILTLESIDELADGLDHSLDGAEPELIDISAETRFWVHCSNMQVWSEYNYDTRLLHSNLAFPLLKKLTEAGDPLAKSVFKKEIAKRINGGYRRTIWFLKNEGYFDFLSHEEQLTALLHPKELDALLEIEHHSNIQLEFTLESSDLLDDKGFLAENKRIVELSLYNCGLKTLPDSIGSFSSLKVLDLARNQLTTLPDSIGNLSCLDILVLGENQLITLPDSIGNLISLRKLGLNDNRLKYLPESIGSLCSLLSLGLERNQLVALPSSIKNLDSLKFIDMEGNDII